MTAPSTWWHRGLVEKSRPRIMDGLRMFITTGNQEAVKVGGLEKHMEASGEAEVHNRAS